ncbi:MAG: acetolactate synthase [Rhodospirillaceae bacterium]|nr:acetolactate synthase [Rhodospirillaceae bacterium]
MSSVAQLLTDSLEAHRIDQVFCVPGESYIGLTSALVESGKVRIIVCRHEAGATFMATADGRLQNRAGVVLVSRGPGLANGLVAIHSAYHDATPLVVIIGQVERADFGRLALQEQNYSLLLADITKSVIEVNQPEMASEAIARAFHIAESSTQGPVAVVIPEDLFDEETHAPVVMPASKLSSSPRQEDLDKLAEMISRAERPLILVGGALLAESLDDADVLRDLNTLSERWVLPVSPTHRRPQLFDSNHPNYGGYMGIRVPSSLLDHMKKTDLMVVLGERLTDTVSQSYKFPSAPKAQFFMAHVWPDADEIGRVWHPNLGIPASPHEVIKGLLRKSIPNDIDKRKNWVETLNEEHNKLLSKQWNKTSDGVNFAAVVCEVDKYLEKDASITSDAGNFGSFIHRYIGFGQKHVFLSSVVGAMGSGMPMAVAAGLRRPGKQTVCFIGDGGVLMMGNEIATAVQYGVNPIIIIADNSMYGTIGMHSYVRYPDKPFMEGTKLTNPDFAAWARSFGAEGITIQTEADVSAAIEKAFRIRVKPVVVHCHTSAIQMSAWRKYERSDTLE